MKLFSRSTFKKAFWVAVVICGITGLFFQKVDAHWFQTHQYMIDLICETYDNDGKDQYCDFLQSIAPDKGLSYLVLLKQGVYDADLRVQGIYAVDFHCEDLSKTSCSDSEKVPNDILEIIVGDHGYNPKTRKGFYSLPEKQNYVKEKWSEWVNSGSEPVEKLLTVLKGKTPVQKKNTLLNLMKKATAADLATFFYNRALIEWEDNHPGDAFYNLGIALHAIQDLSVPHHNRLILDTDTDKRHSNYERYVAETYLPTIKSNPPVIPGRYIKKSPGNWIKLVAQESFNWDLDNPSLSASKSVALGVATSAGLMMNFFDEADIDITPAFIDDPFLITTATINNISQGLTFDNLNNLYISTVGGEVFKLDGKKLSTFIAQGVGGLDFNKHIRFSKGNFYINNVLNVGTGLEYIDEVLLFSTTGTFIRRLLDETDIGDYFFEDIAVNTQGQLYVALPTNSDDVVVRVDSNAQNRTAVIRAGAGGVFVPTSLTIDLNGNLYVGSPSVVSKFDTNGIFIRKIVQEGINGFEFASNLAVDHHNNLYIGNLILGEPSKWNVIRFDSNGNFLGEFIKAGTAGLSRFPEDMGFDIQGRLYIVDDLGIEGIIRFDQSGYFDRIGVKNWGFSSPLTKSSEKLRRVDEIEQHYRGLKLKDDMLAEEFARRPHAD